MKPVGHLLLGIFFSLFLFFANFNLSLILAFLIISTVIIDLDHIPLFIFRERSINPLKFYRWSLKRCERWRNLTEKQKRFYKKPIYFFHNLETLLVLFFLSFFFSFFFLFFLGFLFHLVSDLAYQHYIREEKYHKISLIYTFIKNKNKKDFV